MQGVFDNEVVSLESRHASQCELAQPAPSKTLAIMP
jgi:hypothetical protein